MPSYKDKTTGKWYAKFYYKDNKGVTHTKFKRGFDTKKSALAYERNFLQNINVDLDILFGDFVKIYLKDVKPKIRVKTYNSKIKRLKRILQYFENIPLNKITNVLINDFLNTLILDNLANNTIKDSKKELSTIFNHAIKFYGLKDNPTHGLGNIYNPNEHKKDYNIWTLEDYKKAIELIEDIEFKTLINLMYWSGIRIGEALALTWLDIDFDNRMIKINKSYSRMKGHEYITPTKTYNSRTILLPDTTIEQLKEYKTKLYSTDNRLFTYSNESYLNKLTRLYKKYSLPKITLHDLRHSHASYLLSNKISLPLISKRLGHKNITTTLNTYSHFMPNDEENFISEINKLKLK